MFSFEIYGIEYSISSFQLIFTFIFLIMIIIGLIGSSKAEKRIFSNENKKIAKEMEEEYNRQRREAEEYDRISQDIENEDDYI